MSSCSLSFAQLLGDQAQAILLDDKGTYNPITLPCTSTASCDIQTSAHPAADLK